MTLETVINRTQRYRYKKQPALAIYIELSKAYDTISHAKLLHKLQHEFNFSPSALALFTSYFQNRRQSTHTQHAKSEMRTITHGIPQGSTLSPTLFILYINDIIKTVPKSKVYTYADDTTLVVSADSKQELNTLAQSELNNLIQYFHKNNLVPNAGKTCYTVFYPRTATEDIQLAINGEDLEQLSHAKLLGTYMQKDLKFHKTISTLIRNLQLLIQIFRRCNRLVHT